MKTIQEIATLVKIEFNRSKILSYHGLCGAARNIQIKNIITVLEYHSFRNLLFKELSKRKYAYRYPENDTRYFKKKIDHSEHDFYFIWKPFEKKPRNQFLNKLILNLKL